MKIKNLLMQVNQQSNALSMNSTDNKLILQQNFGDAYLLQKNKIYKNIRKACLNEGYIFSSELNSDYLSLSLSQLENILKDKKIPFFDNVSVLDQIEKKLSNQKVTGLDWDDIVDNLIKNHLFHESCHAVARSMVEKFDELVIHNLNKNSNSILNRIIEESFANTCEFIAIIDVQDAFHRIFYEWNSYTFLIEEKSRLQKMIEDFGKEFVFKFIFYCYLQSNFLKENCDETSFQIILSMIDKNANIEKHHIKNLKSLAKIPFTLNPRFRYITLGLHLKINGYSQNINQYVNLDFFNLIKQSNYQSLVDQLVKLAIQDV